MDTLTHALSGALVAVAVAPRVSRQVRDAPAVPGIGACMLAGFVAGGFPDIDVLLSLFSPIAYLTGHRGLTHSIVMLPLWAALLAWLFTGFGRKREYLRPMFVVCAAALAIHIVGDLVTAFGTMLLEPFSDRRFALSTTFIIDLWFTGIVVAALLLSVFFHRQRMPAVLGLVVLAGYVAFSGVQQERAHRVGLAHAEAQGWVDATVTAVPRPLSPFNWMVVVEQGEHYEVAQINLRRREPLLAGDQAGFLRRLAAAYVPVSQTRWRTATRFGIDEDAHTLAQSVWNHPQFGVFRWFYSLPALYAIERTSGEQCAWFQDLRFVVPGRDGVPFRYGMCRDGETVPWQRFELIGEDGRRPI